MKDINVVGNIMARNGRKTAIYASRKFDAPPSSMAQMPETKNDYYWQLITKPLESFLSIETFRAYVSMLQFDMVNSLALNFSVYRALVS